MTAPSSFPSRSGVADAQVARLIASLEALLRHRGGDAPPTSAPRDSDAGVAVGDAAAVVRRLHDACPDAVWTIDAITSEDDFVLCHTTVAGTHAGWYAGRAPTARRATMHAVFVARRGVDGSAEDTPVWWCALDDAPLRAAAGP